MIYLRPRRNYEYFVQTRKQPEDENMFFPDTFDLFIYLLASI